MDFKLPPFLRAQPTVAPYPAVLPAQGEFYHQQIAYGEPVVDPTEQLPPPPESAKVANGMDVDYYVGLINQYAPLASVLLKGLPPREQVAVLETRIAGLQQYANIPLVGIVAQNKINEYQARLIPLKEQAAQAKAIEGLELTRQVLFVGAGIGAIAAAFAFARYYYKKDE